MKTWHRLKVKDYSAGKEKGNKIFRKKRTDLESILKRLDQS